MYCKAVLFADDHDNIAPSSRVYLSAIMPGWWRLVVASAVSWLHPLIAACWVNIGLRGDVYILLSVHVGVVQYDRRNFEFEHNYAFTYEITPFIPCALACARRSGGLHACTWTAHGRRILHPF